MTSPVRDPIVTKLFRRAPQGVRTTWAVVADGGRARVFERRAGLWSEIEALAFEADDPPSRDWGRDRPGRTHESADQARHAIEPRSDPHEEAKKATAARIAAGLDAAASAGRFDLVFLVAPPRILGTLRSALGPAARRKVSGSLAKDLVHATVEEIVEQLHRHAAADSV
jgi:protein required for attachment to host cells